MWTSKKKEYTSVRSKIELQSGSGPGCVSIKAHHRLGCLSLTLFLPNALRRILQIWNKYELIRFGLPRVKRQGCCDPSGLTLSPQVDSSGIPWGDFKRIWHRWLFLWHKCSRLHLRRFNLNANISLKLWSGVSKYLLINLKWMYLVLKVAETLEYYYCGYNKGRRDVSFKHTVRLWLSIWLPNHLKQRRVWMN